MIDPPPVARGGAAEASPGTRWGRRHVLRLLGAAAVLPSVAACGSGSSGDPRTTETKRTVDGAGAEVTIEPERISYGEDPSQFAELWRPEGEGPFPVLILVHGGFWRAAYDLTLMNELAADAVERRWAVWNIEYRRVGQEGGGWPGTFEDVASAVDHLAVVAGAGGQPLDLDRVAVAGHSAGGHLAGWTATRAGLPGGSPGAGPEVIPVAVVSQAGVLDLRMAVTDGLGGSATEGLMGAAPAAEPERYDRGSPIERVPTGVPIRCVHGLQDDIVPIDQSERYVAAARSVGDVALVAPFDGDHFSILDPANVSWIDTLAWLKAYLQP